MIPRLGRRKRQQRRSEKHGFVIRVRDQEADALVAQVGGGGAGHLGGVEPACGEQDGDREVEIKGHGRGRGRGVRWRWGRRGMWGGGSAFLCVFSFRGGGDLHMGR
jgi:hypothetical protein